LDGRSDLFAVGVMLWEMLTGRTLFGDGGSFDGKLAAVLFLPIPSPREHRPDLPADVCDVVMRLLERDRERRYPTAEDARQALLACRAANRGAAVLELMAILKARFPGQAPQRSSEAGDKARAAPKSALGAFDAVTLLATGQDPPGQFSPAGAAKRARSSAARLALMFAAALVIGVGGTVGVVTLLSRDKAAAAPTPATMTTKEPAIPDVQPRAATTPTAATPAPVALVPAPASTKAPAPIAANDTPTAPAAAQGAKGARSSVHKDRSVASQPATSGDGEWQTKPVDLDKLKPAPNLLGPK
jgi:eukaryotic-like serine/threonine-protein kinase